MKKLAPVVIFVYARPEHTKLMLESLANDSLAKDTPVWIYSDNAKKEKAIPQVKKVREYIHSIEKLGWFKELTIIEAEKNKGLANSVISGVTDIINQFDKVIVLEDDLIVSNNFLTYMNEALEFYKNDSRIWSISGYNLPIEIPEEYNYDVYLGYRGCSWGWATWKDRWNKVDWNVKNYKEFEHSYKRRKQLNRGGPDMAQMLDAQMNKKIDSWAIRWCYAQSVQNCYTVYPTRSLIQNQGLDGSGTHSKLTTKFDVKLSDELPKLEADLKVNKVIAKNFYNQFNAGLKQKILEMIKILRMEWILKIRDGRKKV